MVEKPDQIKSDIRESTRELGRNLHELEGKMRDAGDWKVQFRKHPGGMLGLAFGGGVLLAAILNAGNRNGGPQAAARPNYAAPRTYAPLLQDKRITETWDALKGAMIGIAGAKAKEFLDQMVPGFGEHYDRASRVERPRAERVM